MQFAAHQGLWDYSRAFECRYPLLMIAPEGTTKGSNVLLRFSTGAFVPGQPVLPILLRWNPLCGVKSRDLLP
jgi:hypothetical protein